MNRLTLDIVTAYVQAFSDTLDHLGLDAQAKDDAQVFFAARYAAYLAKNLPKEVRGEFLTGTQEELQTFFNEVKHDKTKENTSA